MALLPPAAMLRGRNSLKAVFSLSAGVDDLLDAIRADPEMMPSSVPLFRLEDAGMAVQMREYAVHTVLGWHRRFDEYRELQARGEWRMLAVTPYEKFSVGVLGAGVLGLDVARALKAWGFPLRCWSRTRKSWPGVESFAGTEELGAFLSQTRVLINLLPNTAETVGIINAGLLSQLQDGAYVLNLARGVHLNEDDLLASLESGKVKGAMLDVYSREPLPENSPLWKHPRVAMTPHIAAVTRPAEAVDYISRTIMNLESGQVVTGQVNRVRGY